MVTMCCSIERKYVFKFQSSSSRLKDVANLVEFVNQSEIVGPIFAWHKKVDVYARTNPSAKLPD